MCGAVSESAQSTATSVALGCHSRSRNRVNRPSAVATAAAATATTPIQPLIACAAANAICERHSNATQGVPRKFAENGSVVGIARFSRIYVPMQCAGAHCKTLKRFCRAIRENGRGIDLTLCPGMTFRDRDANIAVQHHLRQSVIRQGER